MALSLPRSVFITEVGPRDGLQNEKAVVPTAQKVDFINALSRTGLKKIQITSFVHPKWVPQLADAEDVIQKMEFTPKLSYSALVLNERGLDRAIKAGIKEIGVGISASEGHSRRNVNCSVTEALSQIRKTIERAKDTGLRVEAGVMTAFGCSFDGEISIEQVLTIVREYIALQVDLLLLADTTGMANPVQVYNRLSAVLDMAKETPVGAHFHDTRGAGLANVLAAMQAGCVHFDASVGGMGGCPFVPDATGNIDTCDLVSMLHEMDISTGIKLDSLIEVAKMAASIIGRPLPSHVMKTGPLAHNPSGMDQC